jgi:hypothetical protein
MPWRRPKGLCKKQDTRWRSESLSLDPPSYSAHELPEGLEEGSSHRPTGSKGISRKGSMLPTQYSPSP